MHLHPALATYTLFGSFLWSSSSVGGDAGTSTIAAAAPGTTNAPAGTPPCAAAGTCNITRVQEVPRCAGLRIVETTAIDRAGPQSEDQSCPRRSYWLYQSRDARSVLLAEDCATQTAAATLGTATMEIKNCDLLISYTERLWDAECRVRTVGIHLDTLRLFGQTESVGGDRKGKCETKAAKPIRLSTGKGIAGAPLVELDGPTTQELRERERALVDQLRADKAAASPGSDKRRIRKKHRPTGF